MENYLELTKKASGEMWIVFKSLLTRERKPDEWWDDVIDNKFKPIAEKYQGTEAGSYAYHLMAFYCSELRDLQYKR